MAGTTARRWVVRCDDYTTTPSTREVAERKLQWIEQAGDCRLDHHIQEATRE